MNDEVWSENARILGIRPSLLKQSFASKGGQSKRTTLWKSTFFRPNIFVLDTIFQCSRRLSFEVALLRTGRKSAFGEDEIAMGRVIFWGSCHYVIFSVLPTKSLWGFLCLFFLVFRKANPDLSNITLAADSHWDFSMKEQLDVVCLGIPIPTVARKA